MFANVLESSVVLVAPFLAAVFVQLVSGVSVRGVDEFDRTFCMFCFFGNAYKFVTFYIFCLGRVASFWGVFS